MSKIVWNSTAVAGSSTGDQPEHTSNFYKVNVDCWEKILELVSIKDIFAMSKTCKRMRQICGYYLNEFLPGACCIGRDGYPTGFGDHFTQFIKRVTIDQSMFNENGGPILNAKTYCSLKTIQIYVNMLTDSLIDSIKDVLEMVENIEIRLYLGRDTPDRNFNDEIYEKFLKFCPKLKRLSILEQRDASSWRWERPYANWKSTSELFFQQIFPSLEYFEYMDEPTNHELNEINTFLKRNPNVKHFSTNLRQLWMNRESLINSNVCLDCLTVEYRNAQDEDRCPGDWPVMQQFVNLLHSLHQSGFYKTLFIKHFDYFVWTEKLVEEMIKLTALESFSTDQYADLSSLIHLKEVCIYANFTFSFPDPWSLAINLVNLERLVIYYASDDEIFPFFRHSKRLKTVRVISLHIENGALDLFALNMERIKLGATQRVSIHVKEEIYLANKMKEINSHLERVEIVRLESELSNQMGEYYYGD